MMKHGTFGGLLILSAVSTFFFCLVSLGHQRAMFIAVSTGFFVLILMVDAICDAIRDAGKSASGGDK